MLIIKTVMILLTGVAFLKVHTIILLTCVALLKTWDELTHFADRRGTFDSSHQYFADRRVTF